MRFSAISKFLSDPGSRKGRELWPFLLPLALALLCALAAHAAPRLGSARNGIWLSLLALLLALVASIALIVQSRKLHWFRSSLPFSFGITTEGWGFLAGCVLLALAALNTGQNLLYLVLSALLASIVASGIASRLSLRGLSVSLRVPQSIHAGETSALGVSVQNDKQRLPSLSLALEIAASAGNDLVFRQAHAGRRGTRTLAYFPMIPPRALRSVSLPQTFDRRGRYRLEGLGILTRFPFGFFRKGVRILCSQDLIVYPAIRRAPELVEAVLARTGQQEGRAPGIGENLHSIRESLHGDGARHIEWKATARTGTVMIRQHARSEESRFSLLLDTRVPAGEKASYRESFEKAVSRVASTAVLLSERNLTIELWTPRAHIPPGSGTRQLHRMLHLLALVAAEPHPGHPRPTHDEDEGHQNAEGLDRALAAGSPRHRAQETVRVLWTSRLRSSVSPALMRSCRTFYFEEL